jgi:hypothetical protein
MKREMGLGLNINSDDKETHLYKVLEFYGSIIYYIPTELKIRELSCAFKPKKLKMGQELLNKIYETILR